MLMLYKYRAGDRAVEMLRRRRLWAATPSAFNDPFDSTTIVLGDIASEEAAVRAEHLAELTSFLQKLAVGTHYEVDISTAVAAEYLRQLGAATDIGQANAIADRVVGLLHPSRRPLRPRDAIALVERKLAEIGAVSLAARSDSLLMWAHYADCHRGFCLGFELESVVRNTVCAPVMYSRQLPRMNLHEINVKRVIDETPGARSERYVLDFATIPIDDPTLLTVIYSKADHWSYEQEWRILCLRGNVEISFPAALREVVFGMRCPPEMRASIAAAVCDSRGNRESCAVRFREVTASKSEFALSVNDCPSPIGKGAPVA